MSAIRAESFSKKSSSEAKVNINGAERFISAALGGFLALRGLSRFSAGSALISALGGYLLYRGATGHCNVYDALGINTANIGGVTIEGSVLINHSPEEVYSFWRNVENLPQFMTHLDSVKAIDDKRSHWVAKTVEGIKVIWDSEIVEDRRGEMIRWTSLPESDIDNEGVVYFKRGPGGRGTEVKVRITYRPPAGILARDVADLFKTVTFRQLREELRSLKEIMETPVERRRAAGG